MCFVASELFYPLHAAAVPVQSFAPWSLSNLWTNFYSTATDILIGQMPVFVSKPQFCSAFACHQSVYFPGIPEPKSTFWLDACLVRWILKWHLFYLSLSLCVTFIIYFLSLPRRPPNVKPCYAFSLPSPYWLLAKCMHPSLNPMTHNMRYQQTRRETQFIIINSSERCSKGLGCFCCVRSSKSLRPMFDNPVWLTSEEGKTKCHGCRNDCMLDKCIL